MRALGVSPAWIAHGSVIALAAALVAAGLFGLQSTTAAATQQEIVDSDLSSAKPDDKSGNSGGGGKAEEPLPETWTFRVFNANGTDITSSPIRPGETVTIVASGLPADRRVNVGLSVNQQTFDGGFIGSDGVLRLSITIPAGAVAGQDSIVARITGQGGESSTATVGITIGSGSGSESESSDVTTEDDTSAENSPSASGATAGISDIGEIDSHSTNTEAEYGHGLHDATKFGEGLHTADELHLDAEHVAITSGLAIVILLMIVVPGRLLEGTLTHNYGRIRAWITDLRGWIRRHRPRLSARLTAISLGSNRGRASFKLARGRLTGKFPWLTSSWAVVLGSLAATAFILGFSDPGFGTNPSSFRLFLAIGLSLVFINLAGNIAVRVVASYRYKTPGVFTAMPAVLIITVLAVAVSRILHIQPGLLLGLVIGVSLARELRHTEHARLALWHAGTLFTAGVGAWIAYSFVAGGHGDEAGFWTHLAQEVLAATAVEALVGFLVIMLPLEFMEGFAVFAWSRKIWIAAYAVGLVTFLTLIAPMADEFQHWTGNAYVLLTGVVVFTAFALGVWYFFHRIEQRERAEAMAAAAARKKRKAPPAKKKATAAARK